MSIQEDALPLQYAPFVYRARPERVVDGDTLDVTVDLGFNIHYNVRLRLQDIDTAEIYGPKDDPGEYARGLAHKGFVEEFLYDAEANWIMDDWPILIGTTKDRTGKYGRFLAIVMRRSDSAMLTSKLLAAFPDLAEA